MTITGITTGTTGITTMAMTTTQEQAPNDRATSFQAVQGNQGEQYNGATLLVTAYGVLWVVLFAWVALVWRKQSALNARLTDLEQVIDKAAAGGAPEKPGSSAR